MAALAEHCGLGKPGQLRGGSEGSASCWEGTKSGKIRTPGNFLFDICDFPLKMGRLTRFSSKKRSLFKEPHEGSPGGRILGVRC